MEIEEAWVVRTLVRENGTQQSSVALLLRRDQSWVSRRLLLVDALSPEVQMDVRLGLCSPTVAREVARLPRGMQQTIARIIARQGMSTRAAAKFCAATERLQPATAEQIERLCRSAQAEAPARSGPRSDADAYKADSALLVRDRGAAQRMDTTPYDHVVADLIAAARPLCDAIAALDDPL
jgi:hypothetical protein